MFVSGLGPIHQLPCDHELREFFWRLYNHPANNIFMYWPTRSQQAFNEIFENILCKESEAVLVYFEQSKPVGVCRLIIGKGPYAHVATCASLIIEPELKRQGVGARLMQAFEAYIVKNYPAIKKLCLTYEGDNPVARRLNGQKNFYEKCKYITEGRYEDWWPRLKPNYEGMEKNNPYQAWLDENQGDNRLDEHFWPTAEIYAGYFIKPIINNFVQAKGPSNSLRIFPASQPSTIAGYKFDLAIEKNIKALCLVYQDSYSAWNKAYTNEIQLRELLKKAIEEKQLFIVSNNITREIIAACLTFKHKNIEHTLVIENVAVKNQDNNFNPAKILFQAIALHCLTQDKNIKRIELNVVAKNELIIKELEANGFEYCGAEKGKYFDINKQEYIDEFMFDCKLFRLEDALDCCQKRLQAETKLKELKAKIPFNIAWPEEFLEKIISNLKHLVNKNDLSFEQESIVYRLIRIVCTQDYISVQERCNKIRNLKDTFQVFIYLEDIIVQLFKQCDDMLLNKMAEN